ncbi:dehydrogenase E1 component subunit alpha/beta [Arthrobacter sp. NPDC089319]|uniref:alpha-ketoacid dehydrogenase subunit alpha/beta n=1 Tax=Arthrobacter sp. NPDC089319 TaxID=3155915 RepID=UPI00343EEEB1
MQASRGETIVMPVEAPDVQSVSAGPLVDRLALYEQLCTIREFELVVSAEYAAGRIPGFVHTALGQEASALGACTPLAASDWITSNHRGHAHCLAKGMSAREMLAELYGRASGSVGGRGGSMHIADPTIGILGANGIVGAGLPIAVGAALAARLGNTGAVSVAFFGDGAVAQGFFHESINLAALLRLPVIFFCENNGYAEFTAAADGHPVTLSQRAGGYGVPYIAVDGSDLFQVIETMTSAVTEARSNGPLVVEAFVSRFHGHYEGDQQKYRDSQHLQEALERDPIIRAKTILLNEGVSPSTLLDIEKRAATAIAAAAEWAWNEPDPEVGGAADYVLQLEPAVKEKGLIAGEQMKYIEAIRKAISDGLEDAPDAFFAGIDVAKGGGVFGVSRGLWDRFGDRVIDTPISESALLGLAVGGAMAGGTPLVEVMYVDFIGAAFDQILNQAAKMHFMTAGRAKLGMTIRTQFGAGKSAGSQHSQSLEALLAHIPGLTVVMPATSSDAYGLLRTAMESPNPVVFIENRGLYGRRSPAPVRDHRVPIGRARIVRSGTDVTVVSYSRMVLTCAEVAEELESEGISVEVIDLRTISPWDRAQVMESVKKTSRLVIVHEAVEQFGVGAEIAAYAARHGFWYLDAPIVRVAAKFSPAPYSPPLEREWLPNALEISQTIRDTVAF